MVTRNEDIKVILTIFTLAPLNTTKRFNFLNFHKAFELYHGSSKNLELKKEIDFIKGGMNTQRSPIRDPLVDEPDFVEPSKLKITPY
jgi:hypothetical protein